MRVTQLGPTSRTSGGTPTGTAGGDIGGSYPNPTVTGLQGNPVCSDTPTTGQALIFDGTQWCPADVADPDAEGNVFDVHPEIVQSRRYLMRDGTWRNPLLSGDGNLTVGSIATLTDDTKYNAWPNVTRLHSGDLIAVYTKGDSHHADNTGKAVGKIAVEGLNGTLTWGTEFTIYDDPSLWTTPMGVARISTGRIFVTLFRDNASVSGTGEAGIVYSDDDGATWTTWADLTNGFTQESYGAGPVVELSNGDLLVTIEGSNTGQSIANRSSHTLRSTDQGATWGSEVTVRNYVTDSRPYYESKLVVLDNDTLLCIHRCANNAGLPHYISTSTDGGLTWGAPVSAFAGYGAPSTIQASTGTLIAVTRRDSNATAIAYTSTDRGATWSSLVVLDVTMNEMEYGCPVELLDGRLLVVYGYQPTSSTTNADIKTVLITEGTTTTSSTPTGAAGGDLSGTYPNPSVVDDSHNHTAATVSGVGTSATDANIWRPLLDGAGAIITDGTGQAVMAYGPA